MIELIQCVLQIVVSLLLGYYFCKSKSSIRLEKIKKLARGKGEVIKPKTPEEIRKENEKSFYDSIR